MKLKMNGKDLLQLTHLIFCKKSHECEMQDLHAGRDERFCYFYLEQQLTDEKIDMEYWARFAIQLQETIKRNNLDTEQVLRKLLEISGMYYEFLRDKQEMLPYIAMIFNEVIE